MRGSMSSQMQPFLAIKEQLIMDTVEETRSNEQFYVVSRHPISRIHFLFLQAKLFYSEIALQHVQHRKLIIVFPDFYQVKLFLGCRNAEFFFQFAHHGECKIGFATLYMACRSSIIVAFGLGHFLNQVFALVVIDIDCHDRNAIAFWNALSTFNRLPSTPQIAIV